MKQNYIDGKGVYHNELNLTLAQIYDSGVEFGCKVTAKGVIEELEKIKAEIKKEAYQMINIDDEFFDLGYSIADLDDIYRVIDKHIKELKENKE